MWIKSDPDGNLYIHTGRGDETWVFWEENGEWWRHKHGLDRKGKKKEPPAHLIMLATALTCSEHQIQQKARRD